MKHGFLDETSKKPTVAPAAASVIGGSYPIKIHEHQTYVFDGYKQSIIEHLLSAKNIDRVYQFQKNTSVDEHGTGFSDCDMHMLITDLNKQPSTPGEAICEAVRSSAAGIATGVITGTVAALGAVGNALVSIYEITAGSNTVVSNLGFDIRQKATELAATQMYKSKITRQIHHQFNGRIRVALQGRVSPSKDRCHKVISVESTAITGGALAVLIQERA